MAHWVDVPYANWLHANWLLEFAGRIDNQRSILARQSTFATVRIVCWQNPDF
jgi:hypothetical protein